MLKVQREAGLQYRNDTYTHTHTHPPLLSRSDSRKRRDRKERGKNRRRLGNSAPDHFAGLSHFPPRALKALKAVLERLACDVMRRAASVCVLLYQ